MARSKVKKKTYTIKAKVWLYPGESSSWHFLSVPKKESEMIKESFRGLTRGFGSLPVSVTIGKTSWVTSIFPESKSGVYMLPLKVQVRKREGIFEGDTVTVSLKIQV